MYVICSLNQSKSSISIDMVDKAIEMYMPVDKWIQDTVIIML